MNELEELEALRKEQGEEDELAELERLRQEQGPLEGGESIPAWKSAMGGLSQGLTLGLGNRVIAGAEGVGDYALNRAAHAVEGVPYEGPTLGQAYKAKRDELQRSYDEAQKQNPKSYMGGSFAGGAGTSVLPGGAGLKFGLAAGGVQGLGESKADWTLDNAGELAKDAGMGVAGSAGGYVLGKGFGKAMSAMGSKPIQKGLAGTADFVADLPSEVGNKIVERPELAKIEPKGNIDLADSVATRANDLARQLRSEGSKAWDALINTSKEFEANLGQNFFEKPISEAGTSIKDGLRNIPLVVAAENNILQSQQTAQASAKRQLENVMYDIDHIKNWSDLKTVIQNMDDNIDWTNPEKSVANEMLTQTRRRLDAFLKDASPEYEEIMGPIAEKASQLSNLQKRFALKKGAADFTSSDNTVSSAKNLVNNMNKQLSPQLKSDLGQPLQDDFDMASMYKRSRGDTGRGGRGVYWGGFSGAGLSTALGMDPMVGGAIGGLSGMVRDKFGRQIASSLLATGAPAIKGLDKVLGSVDQVWESLPDGQKKVLANAAQRGAQSFMVTWALMNKDQ